MIAFPSWVKITECERETHVVLVHTPHGVIREEESSVTEHGRRMVLWRCRRTEAELQPVVGDRSRSMVVREAERPSRRRRVPAGAVPGRYSS